MKKSIVMLLSLMVVFSSCRRDPVEGPRGPQGPPGPPGAGGGIVSDIYTVRESDWIFEDPSYFGDIEIPDLTEDIVNNGIVLVYLKVDDNTFTQLPLTFYESDEYASTLEVISFPQLVSIVWTDSDLLDGGTPPQMDFRVVFMDGGAGKKEAGTHIPDTLHIDDFPQFFRER